MESNSFILFGIDTFEQKTKSLLAPVFLDGYRIPDLIILHKILKKELQLPSYSEPNLDSLDEILNDPDWIENHAGVCLQIMNYPQFLHLESPSRRRSFLIILNSFSISLGYPSVYIENCDIIQNELNHLKFSFQTLNDRT